MTTKKPKPRPTNLPKPNPAHLLIDGRFVTEAERKKLHATEASEVEKAAVYDAMSARAMSQPEVRAAAVIQEFQGNSLNINSLVDELRQQVSEVQAGGLKRPEAMLIAQAHALDALFSNLARRSHGNSNSGYLDAAEKYLRLALKAQAQAVRTIEALNELKNPRTIAFVQQANIANGPQQVNNGEPRAREKTIQSNELSGDSYDLLPNTRTQSLASRPNQEVEAVGEIYRPTDAGRKSSQCS